MPNTAPNEETAAENSEGTAKRGRPFPAGQSGNPGGRPKGIARRVRETIGEDGDSLVGFWGAVLSGELRTIRTTTDERGEKTGTETTYEAVSVSDRIAVSKLLAERGWGRPPQFAPIEDDDPLDLAAAAGETMAEALERKLDEVAAKRREREERERAAPG